MVEQTKKGEKFSAARRFLKNNPAVAKTLMNWQKMHGPTLYKALALSGVQWDMVKKCWYSNNAEGMASAHIKKVSPPALNSEQLTIQVRIIADEKQIARALAETLEMARALDWLLLRNSGVRKGHYGSGRLVYLKFRLPRS